MCIHANKSEIKYEKWTETLEEVYECSDGVTVDLTPPSSGQVWVGNNPNSNYQVRVITTDSNSYREVEGRTTKHYHNLKVIFLKCYYNSEG